MLSQQISPDTEHMALLNVAERRIVRLETVPRPRATRLEPTGRFGGERALALSKYSVATATDSVIAGHGRGVRSGNAMPRLTMAPSRARRRISSQR